MWQKEIGILVKKATVYILDFLVQSYGGEKYNKLTTRWTIKRILRNDIKEIKKNFILPSEKEIIEDVEIFLLDKVFCDVKYFDTQEITSEVENEIWEEFCKKYREKHGHISNESKPHLIKCVKYHNANICKNLLDEVSIFNIKIAERNNKKTNKKLDYLINVLDNKTELQVEDVELDYYNLQINSILNALQVERKRARLLQFFLIGDIIILWLGMSYIFIKDGILLEYKMFMYVTIAVIMSIVVALIILINKRINRIEKRIDSSFEELYEIHFKAYSKNLEKKA